MISRYRVLCLSLSVRRALGLSLLALAPLAHAESPLDAVYTFQIPAQSTSDALNQFSKQSGLRLLFSYEALQGRSAPKVAGEYKAEEVLKKLLSGTDLKYQITEDAVVVVHEPGRFRPISHSSVGDELRVRLAHAEVDHRSATGTDEAQFPSDEESGSPRKGSGRVALEEVVVTGSHIRGVQNLSSPVITFDRQDIEASGYSTTEQLVQALPQNVSNVSDTTFGSINGGPGSTTTYFGSGINLRGLGADSTLVLLNGRRLAAAGNGSFVDLSLIPLNAVERLEILTDGASAIYGSDAVGGVVNIVLRDDFEGAETRLRYGSVTQGDHREAQASQMLGHAWASGQALLNYEYHERTELLGSERSNVFRPLSYHRIPLIPEQQRHGAVAMLSQRLSPTVELSGDMFFGQRDTASTYATSVPRHIDASGMQYGAAVGLDVQMARDWEFRASGLFNESESELEYILTTSGRLEAAYENSSRLWSVDVTADGPIATLAGGEVRLAVGGQYRDEGFVERNEFSPASLSRNILAGYAELIVPWVGANNRRAGLEHLEVTVAARYEEYSDFGATFNPKAGLAWAPVTGLNVRGTWGTSFKAPLLADINPAGVNIAVYEGLYRDRSGPVPVLNLGGSGADLGPEESENWTAGIDFTPPGLDRLSLSASYFSIDYQDRIRGPFAPAYDPETALLDPAYQPVITWNPSAAQLAPFLSDPRATCYLLDWAPCPAMISPELIRAIVDGRLRNLAGVQTRGVDVSASYRWTNAFGSWSFNLGGQKLLENREQLVSTLPSEDRRNTVWAPVELRVRGGLSFRRGAANATLFVNYTDGYRDTRGPLLAGPLYRETVGSWTTLDATIRYELGSKLAHIGFDDVSVSFSAFNLLDRDPPFIATRHGIYYDGVNANPRGRFVSAQLTAKW